MNRIYIILVILAIGLIGYFCYNKFAFLHIVVKFDDLEPFEKQMNVYYKGFKIGKTTKIYPDEEYKNTYILLKLHPADIKLPKNITARIQSSKSGRYVNILYPDSPSLTKIKNSDVIKGKLAKDITSLINDDGFSIIINDATTLIESSNITVQNLGVLFNQLNKIVSDTREDIISTSSNIEKISNNLEIVSKNLNKFSTNINETSMPIVNSTLCEAQSTVQNTNEITDGIKNTLKKRMGLFKLFFGKPINENCD